MNPYGNPDIAKYGRGTRFGQPGGADPSSAAKQHETHGPCSLRYALRIFLSLRIDADDKHAMHDALTDNGRRIPTITQQLAMAMIQRSIVGRSADFVALTDAAEGKLPRTVRKQCAQHTFEPPVINIIYCGNTQSQ